MKIIGLIPARGGSKRIPRKNIKIFLGKPLIYWTIKVAKESKIFDRIILSTEDEEIAKIGKKYGVEIPFKRPKKLATDKADSFSVIRHTLMWLIKKEKYFANLVVLLEPSSPGRRPFHIREALKIIKKNAEIDSLIGISKVAPNLNPLKILKLGKNNLVFRFTDGEKIKNLIHRNQELPVVYHINSALYIFRAKNVLKYEGAGCYGEKVYGYLMDPIYDIDIDEPDDWEIAEFKMKKILNY